jgi:IS30 family transposase
MITQEKLDAVAFIVNNIPRKSLKFLTPAEVFYQDYRLNSSDVALHC